MNNIELYLKQHQDKSLLRFLTCGSVDDGKSTLIGRLLYDSKMLFEDHIAQAKQETIKYGTVQNEELDFALLVDGLQSEREQGITIDVAYRFFTTEKRKYIIADTPGHEQYTRNMVTGASTSDVAIILIDARKGILTQTKRHSFIVSLLGIKHLIIAINKMDLVNYQQEVFENIKNDYQKLASELNISNIYFIPISALKGDNVVELSKNMQWFKDKPLLKLLDSIEMSFDADKKDFRFPVQYVNRPHLNFRGFCGNIISGSVEVGDEITILPSGKTTKVKKIINAGDISEKNKEVYTKKATVPMAITLTTEDEIDINRGDMIVHTKNIPSVSNKFKAMVVWFDEVPLEINKTYSIKRATTLLTGFVKKIDYKVDVNTYQKEKVDKLNLNDIALCELLVTRPISVDKYYKNHHSGSFIIIDNITNNTVGAGMIIDIIIDENETDFTTREYSETEKALNEYIRTYFPEWGCKKI
jgi:sulfate adenylyltransferase subunit 1